MSGEKACAYTPTKTQKIRHFYYTIKYNVYMKWHWFYWKVLHLSGLARPYSVLMCRFNLYIKFPDGRCQWCGENHK